MGEQMLAAVRECSADPAVRSILITGAGRAFSSGADLKGARETTDDGVPDLGVRLRSLYNPIVLALREAPKPVVAGVNGPAAGIGASFALASDLIVMAESAYLLLAFVRVGLAPDGGASLTLAARAGMGRAQRMAMLGERLEAARALEWGVADEVVADDALRDRAIELADQLAAGPTVAYASIKEAFNTACLPRLAEQLDLEATLQQRHATTADYVEGVAAFRAKRPAEFRGA